ncbi:diguanylate cyclase/phosphodiesterase YegE [Erwinia tracheiphila PSU-1]|nr:diguanylate cyclase/phosphodiesterase YegE [Erwinia tracheiphila PSU-1]
MEYSATSMALLSVDGLWLQVNKSLCNVPGYQETELTAMNFQQITHPDNNDAQADLQRLTRHADSSAQSRQF